MEIVSIPLQGAIAHKDSTGTDGIIKTGDVQIMSAGSGIRHSEYNASKTDAVNFLQLWVFPKQQNIKPRYDQKTYDASGRKNKWQVVVSPVEGEGGLWINQDARFALARIEKGESIEYKIKFPGNGVYFFVIEGEVEVDGKKIGKRDAIGVWETTQVDIKSNADAEILAIEIPMLN
jgi:hypothetical protein